MLELKEKVVPLRRVQFNTCAEIEAQTARLHARTPHTCNSVHLLFVLMQEKDLNYQRHLYIRSRCEQKAIMKLPKD